MTLDGTQEAFGFSVDTHLFRELGELLVGRDSTALMELIKNAYDADATQVVVRGERLRHNDGVIVVADDGVGMTPDVFRGAFLRIAGRYKEQGSRRSPHYGRRYTGAKGVGRLSAHKLARRLVITSMPRVVGNETSPARGIRAVIDWQRVEDDYETLEDANKGLDVRTFAPDPQQGSGTELRLEDLRRRWTPKALDEFIAQVSSSTPPHELVNMPPDSLFPNGTLLDHIVLSTRREDDPGFAIKFEGELDAGEDLWPQLLEQTDWLVEISAQADGVLFNIQPSRTLASDSAEVHDYQLRRDHPDPRNGPFFTARIYLRQGPIAGLGSRTASLRTFARRTRGVRVYVEGFRVLPYGDTGDDWLNLDRDYARRQRTFDIELDANSSRLLQPVEQETFLVQGNDQYAGAVFMTGDDAAALRPVVNREGFVHDAAFDILRELVRNGVDLLTRVRASHRRGAANQRLSELAGDLQTDEKDDDAAPAGLSAGQSDTSAPGVEEAASGIAASTSSEGTSGVDHGVSLPISVMRRELRALHEQLGNSSEESSTIERLEKAIDYIEEAARGDDGRATLQILAGVGLQLAAFVHDINGVLGLAQSVRSLAEAVRREVDPEKQRAILRDLEIAADELVQSLARQSSYLVEVVGPDARRRRRRIPITQAIQPSLRLLAATIADRRIEILQELDANGKTPPIFPAELAIIVTNILTNAIKAAGKKGRILIYGAVTRDGGFLLRVENTGVRVNLSEAERWFRPFESTTTDVDIVLGQGMGMGLPIVRRLVSEYNGNVRFVSPSSEFDTAVEVTIPGRRIGQ